MAHTHQFRTVWLNPRVKIVCGYGCPFDTIQACDGWMDGQIVGHLVTVQSALCIASRGKN